MKTNQKAKGFTLLELLVVISLIGLLAAIVLVSLNSAREKGKIARAQLDLQQLDYAMELMASDTGKWAGGCPQGATENPEIYFDDPYSGLLHSPTGTPPDGGSGYTINSCFWFPEDLAKWRGPYIGTILPDPWGHMYLFDPDYCNESGVAVVVILSLGPDGVEEYKTNCGITNHFNPFGPPPGDDIVLYPGSNLIPIP